MNFMPVLASSVASDLPEPPVPADADLRHFAKMPLHVQRLRDSELASVPDAEVRWAALMSWVSSWHQVPAGSLPDDDVALCRLLGYGRDLRTWRRLRAKGALRGWFMCRDGRLYHRVVAEMAEDSLRKSRRQSRNANERWNKQSTEIQENPSSHGNASGDPGGIGVAMPRREGRGEERIRDTPSSPEEREEGESTGKPVDSPSLELDGNPPAARAKMALSKPVVSADTLWELIGIWNDMAARVNLPQVQELSDKRAKALRARISERWQRDPEGMFGAYCSAIAKSPFLTGENDRRWRADFDWALQPANVLKVLEGKYDGGGNQP